MSCRHTVSELEKVSPAPVVMMFCLAMAGAADTMPFPAVPVVALPVDKDGLADIVQPKVVGTGPGPHTDVLKDEE